MKKIITKNLIGQRLLGQKKKVDLPSERYDVIEIIVEDVCGKYFKYREPNSYKNERFYWAPIKNFKIREYL